MDIGLKSHAACPNGVTAALLSIHQKLLWKNVQNFTLWREGNRLGDRDHFLHIVH